MSWQLRLQYLMGGCCCHPGGCLGEELCKKVLHFDAVTPIMEMSHRRLETAGWWPGKGRTRKGIQGLQHLEEELWAQVRLPGERARRAPATCYRGAARWKQRDGHRVTVGDGNGGGRRMRERKHSRGDGGGDKGDKAWTVEWINIEGLWPPTLPGSYDSPPSLCPWPPVPPDLCPPGGGESPIPLGGGWAGSPPLRGMGTVPTRSTQSRGIRGQRLPAAAASSRAHHRLMHPSGPGQS